MEVGEGCIAGENADEGLPFVVDRIDAWAGQSGRRRHAYRGKAPQLKLKLQ